MTPCRDFMKPPERTKHTQMHTDSCVLRTRKYAGLEGEGKSMAYSCTAGTGRGSWHDLAREVWDEGIDGGGWGRSLSVESKFKSHCLQSRCFPGSFQLWVYEEPVGTCAAHSGAVTCDSLLLSSWLEWQEQLRMLTVIQYRNRDFYL